MHQFFVEDDQVGKEYITITGSDVNHIKKALRMKRGEKIRVSTSSRRDYYCVISEIGESFIQADIADENAPSTELPSKIYLFQALPKGDRMEYIIQKAVELGVYEIIPVSMKYCVVKLDQKREKTRIARWQAISESAAKQSKRSMIPLVHTVMDFNEAARYASQCDVRIVPYENHSGMASTGIALNKLQPGKSVSVIIGPEGGFAPEEIDALRSGFDVVSLGKRILRTDTAAISMMSLIMLKLEMSR